MAHAPAGMMARRARTREMRQQLCLVADSGAGGEAVAAPLDSSSGDSREQARFIFPGA